MASEALPSLRQADAPPDVDADLDDAKSEPINELERLRVVGVAYLTFAGWGVTTLLLALSFFGGLQVLLAGLVSVALNIGPSVCALQRRCDKGARLLATIMAAIQPALVIFALTTCGFPSDSHLAFFLALAAIAVMCDQKAIWIAAGIMLAHHNLSGWAFPDPLLHQSAGSAPTVIQCLRTMLVAALAGSMTLAFRKVLERLEAAKADNAQRANLMRRQFGELQRAHDLAKLERQQREQSEAKQSEARKLEIARIIQEFEDSFSVVTGSISQTAQKLDRTSKSLHKIAHQTGKSAADVSQSTQIASRASQTVAQGVAELSSSIANIATSVGRQDDLTSRATTKSQSGGKAVGGLAQHSDTISEATRAIVRIAERTNLLSLNAAIEAASAGPAGRGFTIVAQEVKGLALQASQAATAIDDFLKGVQAGTYEAEHSFQAIDNAISELAQATTHIRWDVEKQHESADQIEDYAHSASEDIAAIARRSEDLAVTASSAQELSGDLDQATAEMLRNVSDLERSAARFVAKLKAG